MELNSAMELVDGALKVIAICLALVGAFEKNQPEQCYLAAIFMWMMTL